LALWDTLDKQHAHLAKPGPAHVIYEIANGKGPVPHEDEPHPSHDEPDSPLPADAGKGPFRS
jgi:hypothetical protein